MTPKYTLTVGMGLHTIKKAKTAIGYAMMYLPWDPTVIERSACVEIQGTTILAGFKGYTPLFKFTCDRALDEPLNKVLLYGLQDMFVQVLHSIRLPPPRSPQQMLVEASQERT